MRKKFLSVILACIMALGSPLMAFAEVENGSISEGQQIIMQEPTDNLEVDQPTAALEEADNFEAEQPSAAPEENEETEQPAEETADSSEQAMEQDTETALGNEDIEEPSEAEDNAQNQQKEAVLRVGDTVIEKNPDIVVPENLEVQPVEGIAPVADEGISTTADNHAPIAGLQFGILNEDTVIEGNLTQDTLLGFFWKWDNTWYTYDIDEGDTLSLFVGGVPSANIASLGGSNDPFEGFAVGLLPPGDYELTFYVEDSHGARSNVVHFSFTIVDKAIFDVTAIEDKLDFAEDVKMYTIPIDFTKTPEADICLIRKGTSGLNMLICGDDGKAIATLNCGSDVSGRPESYEAYTKKAFRVTQGNGLPQQNFTVVVRSHGDFDSSSASYNITYGSSAAQSALLGGKENCSIIFPSKYDLNYRNQFYRQEHLPSTNPKQGHWYSFTGDGKMMFTIFQNCVQNSALRFQIRTANDVVVFDSSEGGAKHVGEMVSDGVVTYPIVTEKAEVTTIAGQQYYLVVYATAEQDIDDFFYTICIGDPLYVQGSVTINFQDVPFESGKEKVLTFNMKDVPDTVKGKSFQCTNFPAGGIAGLTWYYRHGSMSNWKMLGSILTSSKLPLNWKNKTGIPVNGQWQLKFNMSANNPGHDVEVYFCYVYELGDQYIVTAKNLS